MAKYRSRPPSNKQNLTYSCWAAALDSFSRVTAGVPTLKEKDLIAAYGTGTNGALGAPGLARLKTALAAYGVRVDLLASLGLPYDIEDRLQKSHVVLARQVAGDDWHAWMVYGIDNFVLYMDPRDGVYHSVNWATGLTSVRGWYLFWKP